jgi:hypothetical protein
MLPQSLTVDCVGCRSPLTCADPTKRPAEICLSTNWPACSQCNSTALQHTHMGTLQTETTVLHSVIGLCHTTLSQQHCTHCNNRAVFHALSSADQIFTVWSRSCPAEASSGSVGCAETHSTAALWPDPGLSPPMLGGMCCNTCSSQHAHVTWSAQGMNSSQLTPHEIYVVCCRSRPPQGAVAPDKQKRALRHCVLQIMPSSRRCSPRQTINAPAPTQ